MSGFRFLDKDAREALNFDYYEADRKMMWILWVHAFFAIFVTSHYYQTLELGVIGSLVLLILTSVAYFTLRGTLWFRVIAAVAVMGFSALYIQQHLGRIEMHFHVFIGLAILTIYKDTLPMIAASIGTIVYHFLFNWFQSQNLYIDGHPIMIFSYGCGIEFVYLHGVMVVAEALVLSYIIHTQTRQFLKMIEAQKALDYSNEKLEAFNLHLEEEVRSRTEDLKVSLDKQIELTEELRVARDQADSANRLKSEFLANMSHEIRTPLNAVIGFSDLLEQRIQEPKEKGYLQAIKNGGRTLLTLINDILDLSKIEAGHMKIEVHPLHITPFIREIFSLFDESAKKKALSLSYRIDDNIPEWINADEIHIRQVLLNLLSNAMKFTHEGSIVLELKGEIFPQMGTCNLIFTVQDSGIGISAKNQTKIFDAFVQNEGQDTRKYGGTGLGLSICRKLARLMGGEMEIESVINEGSRFIFSLNGIEISEPLFVKENYPSFSQDIIFESASILVVDDIAENRLLLREVLSSYPFEIDEASDGAIAIEKIQETSYDLILMDIRMPNMDGWEAIRIIREELHLSVPVVAVTASVMKHDHTKLSAVFDTILEKPINRHALLSTIARFIPSAYAVESPKVLDSVDVGTEDKIENIIDELRALSPNALEALRSGDMEKVTYFGETIERLGSQNSIQRVVEFGKSLKEATEGFDIESVERLLRSYDDKVNEWESK